MLTIVMANPMHVTIVRAVPLYSGTAVLATSVENCGESAATVIPHTMTTGRKMATGKWKKANENRLHNPEVNRAKKATRLLPVFCETYPPAIQPTPPAAIMTNDHNGTFIA